MIPLLTLLSLAIAQEPEAPPPPAPPDAAALAAQLQAEGVPAEEAGPMAQLLLEQYAVEQSLAWQQGDVVLADGKLTLRVPEGLRYLSPADADRVLGAWGNPPMPEGLGMLAPAGLSPFAAEGWVVVLSYEEEGHIEDDDAQDIDYDELLQQMKDDTEASNAARAQAGYEPIHIAGWAEPPRYDEATRRLYWAKILTNDSGGSSLNYDVRLLGRQGVFSMNAVADASQQAAVTAQMASVITLASFNDGHRYEQFDPKLDKVAAYGLAALVAGTAASKAGLLKGLLALLIAGKKFVVIAIVALAAGVKGLLSRKDGAPKA